jgi:ribosomal protein S18 acetylase RimI-like enzyme
MVVRHLGQTDFEIIMECFLLSFKNYFVTMPTDHNFYKRRWKSSGVRLDLSYGMFDENRLVGFIINSIDERDSHLIAYNSGTGVIPKYRGRRIVKTIYDHAIPELLKKGISKCQLEVITENTNAIKSYEGIGFIKCKHYACYKGKVTSKTKSDYVLTKVAMPNLNLEVSLN